MATTKKATTKKTTSKVASENNVTVIAAGYKQELKVKPTMTIREVIVMAGLSEDQLIYARKGTETRAVELNEKIDHYDTLILSQKSKGGQ